MKEYEFRLNSPNLWGSQKEYYLYPQNLKAFKNGEKYTKKEVREKVMDFWKHVEIKEDKAVPRTAGSGITEYLYGIKILTSLKDKNERIDNRGINIFRTIPYTSTLEISEEGIKLRDSYIKDPNSDEWKLIMLELFLKYDVRFRAVLLQILYYKNRLKIFIVGEDKKEEDVFKFLKVKEIYLEDPQLNEKYPIFQVIKKKANKNNSEDVEDTDETDENIIIKQPFNEIILSKNQFEIIGPFLRKKFLDDYNFEILEEDKITFTGKSGLPAAVTENFNAFKKLVIVMKDVGLINNNQGFLDIIEEKFINYFDEAVVKDFLLIDDTKLIKINEEDDLDKFYLYLKKIYEEEVDKINNYAPIGVVYLKVCEALYIRSEKEKKFCEMFHKLNKKKYELVRTRAGMAALGEAPCGDPLNNRWQIKFF